MTYLLTALMATLMGFTMGFLGSGGTILTVPTLVYVLGFDPKAAVPMSLVIVGLTASMGCYQRYRQGMVDIKAGLLYSATGTLGTLAGTRVATFFTGLQQMALFSIVMMTAAGFMLKRGMKKNCPTQTTDEPRKFSYPIALGLGAIVGLLTGIVGVGGGFIIVPALTSAGLVTHIAMGTSLLAIAINCVAGVIGYSGKAVYDWHITFLFFIFSGTASLCGARLTKGVDNRKMSLAFAVFLFILGVAILYKNRGVFT